MSGSLKIAIAGLGTVGSATVALLREQAALLAERSGKSIDVVAVSARDRNKLRGIDISDLAWVESPEKLASVPGVEVVVELIGGAGGAARATVEAALAGGKHLVTANKALLARNGNDIARAAEEAGVEIGFEAAVGGAIPVIDALQDGLAANEFRRVYGILNGTCNYILTRMQEEGLEYADVVADAQRLGYAEADPSVDVDGQDTAHKLALLTSLGFGCAVNLAGIHVEGIRDITQLDVGFARELGYRIKLLGIARMTEAGVEQRVHPCLVPESSPLAKVQGVINAVVAEGRYSGNIVLEGFGAGGAPTASSVVSDIVRIARGVRRPAFGVPASRLRAVAAAPMTRHVGQYYIRLMVKDRPGVIADVAAILRDSDVSLASMLQRGRSATETVPVVLTTHETTEERMGRAAAAIGRLDSVVARPRMIRIEPL